MKNLQILLVELKQLPINRNGKIDIDALPDPTQEPDYEQQNYQPWSAYEEIIAGGYKKGPLGVCAERSLLRSAESWDTRVG